MMERGIRREREKEMIQELQEEMNLVFDFSRSGITAESSQRAPNQKDVAKLDFGSDPHLMAMVFTADPPRRFLSRSVKYAAVDEEPVFYSVPPFDGPYHRHNAYELTCVVSGRFTYVMSGREVTVRAGEALLMDLNCVHFDRNRAEDAAVLYLHFTRELLHRFADYAGETAACAGLLSSEKDNVQRFIHYHPKETDGTPRMEQLFAELIRETNRDAYGSREMFSIVACRLLQHLEQNYAAESLQLANSLQKDLFLIEADRYIQDHLPTVTTGDLVRRFHFNSDYFSRKIRQKYGVTLTEYIQRKRVEAACQLLAQTDLPVLEVIACTGYKNARYFYKIFREASGMTPAEYRRRMREASEKPGL